MVLSVLWWCIKPSTVAPASLLVGIGLLVFGRRRAGVAVMAVGAFVLLNALVLPTAQVLTTALERRVEPVTELPAAVDGIIVLGGNSAVRLPPFAELAVRYPEATVVFSGGGGEAESARRLLSDFDDLVERMIFEDRSRNTYENALFSQRLVQPEADEMWVLVTSAMHMARAVGVFEGIGWRVRPYPVRHTETPREGWYAVGRVRNLDEAWRELVLTAAGFAVPGLVPAPSNRTGTASIRQVREP